MKGIDTNVLVRLLILDNPSQVERARAFVRANAPCWINRLVLCEAVWVLERRYGHSKNKVAMAIAQLLEADEFEFEDPVAMQVGVAALEVGLDFSDAVIEQTNLARGCETTATFDRRATRLASFEAL